MSQVTARRAQFVLAQESFDVSLEHNLAVVERVARETTPGEMPTVIVLPELFLTGYAFDDLPARALPRDGDAIGRIREVAGSRRVGIVVGFAEADRGTLYNSMLVAPGDGGPAHVYRKCHLFGEEAVHFAAGDVIEVAECDGVRLGLMTCFDLEFPEHGRTLASLDPDVFVTISANMTPYANDHRVAGAARAMESRVPLVYVNLCGDNGREVFTGGSRVIDPSGHIVAEFADAPARATVTVPYGQPVPEALDYVRQLRPALYRARGC